MKGYLELRDGRVFSHSESLVPDDAGISVGDELGRPGDHFGWDNVLKFEPVPIGWHITYKAEKWSLQWCTERPKPKIGATLDCGFHESLDDWLEGVLPGTYVCEHHDMATVVLTVAKEEKR